MTLPLGVTKVIFSDNCSVNHSIIIRKAKETDYKTVADIGRATFYETWRAVNTEDDMQVYMAEAFNEQQIGKDIEDASNTFLLAELNGQTIGYAKLRADRGHNEFKGSRAMEMERLYVLKEHHGQKAGKLLMDESIRIAKEQKFDWLWLGVATENHKALNFYKSYGFTVFGKKAFKLGNAVDYDYLMKMKV